MQATGSNRSNRHAAEEGEGAVMGVEHHLLGFPGVGDDEHLPAVGQAEVGHLDGLHDAVDLDMLVAPVELADLARREHQGHEGVLDGGPGLACLPLLHKALHAVVGAAIALSLQALEQTARGAPLGLGEMPFGLQPAFQRGLEFTQLGGGLLLAAVDRLGLGLQMLANGLTGELQVTGNRADALLADQVAAPDFGYDFHG